MEMQDAWTTPEWWNEQCREQLQGAKVMAAIANEKRAIKQLHSIVVPFTLRMEGDSSERRVVVKQVELSPGGLDSPGAPKADGDSRSSSRSDNRSRSYKVEAAFYQRCASKVQQAGARLPYVLHCESTPASLLLVLEDLTAPSSGWDEVTGRSMDQALVLDMAKAKCALDWAARLHACFWGEEEGGDLWERGTYWTLDKRQRELAWMEQEWQKTVAAFEEEYPEVFQQPGVRQLAKRLRRAAVALDNEISPDPAWESSKWMTVVHGDFKCHKGYLQAS